MNYFINYILFAAKFITVIASLLVFISVVLIIASKTKGSSRSGLKTKSLSKHLDSINQKLLIENNDTDALKQLKKDLKLLKKEKKGTKKSKLYVLDFKGDIRAKATSGLKEQINAILLCHNEGDEVLMKLESGGGVVTGYGLAASQLGRLREANIPLTIAIDKVAASGGYMMAAVANKIIAAPFAIVGSIGVVTQIPNIHRYLEKKDIDVELFTAGKYKRTVTMLGKNTKEGRDKLQEELEETHDLFKAHIKEYRPSVDCDAVATGEHWYACDTLDKNLVDEIKTSDDFILENHPEKNIIQIDFIEKQSKLQKLGGQVSALISHAVYHDRYGA